MGLADLFKKKANYFDSKITPQCAYCQFGKRTKNGGRILCEKKGLVEETASCGKFIYSPLKRVPVKQLEIEGALTDEEMYVEVSDSTPSEEKNSGEKSEEAAKSSAEVVVESDASADELQKALAAAEAVAAGLESEQNT